MGSKQKTSTRSRKRMGSPRVWEQAYEKIKNLILTMEYRPGDIVAENSISKKLGVSRTPAREALKRLEQEGLVVVSNRRRRVYVLTLTDIRQIFDLKRVIEGGIARWAAERGSKEDLARLRAIVAEMGSIVTRKPSTADELASWKGEWQEADVRFHRQLSQMAGNVRAEQYINSLNAYWHRLRLGILAMEGRIETSWAEHSRIAEAILDRNPAAAQEAMESHLENLKTMIINLMEVFHYPV
jgi:DNA-binding GntR family transcriptional regulator